MRYLCIALCLGWAAPLHAQPDKYDASIQKGLVWLAKQQATDGHWCDANDSFPVATTAFAGMAFLAEGSTPSQGKYRDNLRQSLAWFHKQTSKDKKYRGLLVDVDDMRGSGRYMPQHGVALSFLSKLYGEIEDREERDRLRTLLTDAIAFSVAGQTSFGGWFYTSVMQGHNAAENVSTMIQIQGLLDARDMGLPVPREALKKAHDYIKSCTNASGGISYGAPVTPQNPQVGGGRPTINAMALAAYMPRQSKYDDATRQWLAFCADSKAFAPANDKNSLDMLIAYYFVKVAYHLDAKQWQDAFPARTLPEHMNWSKYRSSLFDHLQRRQDKEGAWTSNAWSGGPVFNTALALNILLYEQSIPAAISR